MTVNMKFRNDQIRVKRAENKVKKSNIVYNLVNARNSCHYDVHGSFLPIF